MTEGLIEKIEAAEAEAEGIRAGAVREAREMVKAVEEACLEAEREAAKDARAAAQKIIEEARLTTQDEINTLEVRRSAEREAMRELAASKSEHTTKNLFERIVLDGNR